MYVVSVDPVPVPRDIQIFLSYEEARVLRTILLYLNWDNHTRVAGFAHQLNKLLDYQDVGFLLHDYAEYNKDAAELSIFGGE